MSKRNELTPEEFSSFTPNPRIIHYLEQFREARGLRKDQTKVLDWGCGRGRTVLWLLEQGYDAYGIDIDPIPIQNGLDLIEEKGYSKNRLRLLDAHGKTDFTDETFDFTLSGQVFEHVQDMDSVAEEIFRLTKTGGMGFHEYPSYRYIREPHLFMPFVHWLPKSKIRKALIGFYVKIGKEPHWPEVENASLKQKTETYYRYSVEKTHYRKPAAVREIFQNHGFEVQFETIHHPKVTHHSILGKLARNRISRGILNYLLLTFRHQELSIAKL